MFDRIRISKKNIFLSLLFLLSLVIIASYIHIATTSDEKFTMMLIDNKVSTLIKYDSWDVHPPFYYLILKLFLTITTFWTRSLSIKIIFSRLLSLIFATITFIYLYKLLNFIGIHINWVYQWIIYVSLPNVLSSLHLYSTNPIITIRMYSLSAMIIVMEFYYLLKLNHSNINEYLCILTTLFTISMYTHYFAAIISFSMCFVFFIKYMVLKNHKIALKLIGSFIIAGVLYFPWLPFLYTQLTLPKGDGTYNLNTMGFIESVIKFLVFVIAFFIPIIWAYYHLNRHINILSYEICGTLLLTFILTLIISVIIQPIFDNRYLYPILLIYELFSMDILFKYMCKCQSKGIYAYLFMVLIVLILNVFGSTYYQVFDIDIPYKAIDENINKMTNSHKKRFYLNQNNNNKDVDGTAINLEYAFRLTDSNKQVVTKDFHMKDKLVDRNVFRPICNHIISQNKYNSLKKDNNE